MPAFRARQRRHPTTDGRQTRGDGGAASIDRGFVVGRRLEADETLDGLEQPRPLGAAEIPEAYNFIHAVCVAVHRSVAIRRATAAAARAAAVPETGPANASGDDRRGAARTPDDDLGAGDHAASIDGVSTEDDGA